MAVLIPALPELGFQLAAHIASLDPKLRERSFVWAEQAPAGLKELMLHALEIPHAVLVAPEPAALEDGNGEMARIIASRNVAIVLWDAPAHPMDGLLGLYRLHALAPSAPLVLALEPEHRRLVTAQLELRFPDRDRLGRIYVAMKETMRRAPSLGKGEIAAAVEARWPGIVTRRTVEAALTIFAELGLVEAHDGGFTLAQSEAKVDLAKSLRYNEGIEIRSGYLRFANDLTHAAPQRVIDLLIERGTPWWPQWTSRR